MDAPNPREARPLPMTMLGDAASDRGVSLPALGLWAWLHAAPENTDAAPWSGAWILEMRARAFRRFQLEQPRFDALVVELLGADALTLQTEAQS